MQEDDHLRTIVDTEVDDEHSRKPDVEARRLGLSACLQAAATRERRDSGGTPAAVSSDSSSQGLTCTGLNHKIHVTFCKHSPRD